MAEEAVRARDVREWVETAIADAERRGLPELAPLLENLAQALATLRAADWNDDARGEDENASGKGA
jgi:hypothetical protein